jgi:hypothetical protein
MNGMLDLIDYELACPPELFAAEARPLHEFAHVGSVDSAAEPRKISAASGVQCEVSVTSAGYGSLGDPGATLAALAGPPEHTNRAESAVVPATAPASSTARRFGSFSVGCIL